MKLMRGAQCVTVRYWIVVFKYPLMVFKSLGMAEVVFIMYCSATSS